MSQDIFFQTDNLELASFLLAKKIPLAGSGSNGRFIIFFFQKSPLIETFIQEFFNNALVAVRDYVSATETLRDLIKEKQRERVG